MSEPQTTNFGSFEAAHVCSKCGHVLNLDLIDLKGITTGIVECPNCKLSGSVEIRIVNARGEVVWGGQDWSGKSR